MAHRVGALVTGSSTLAVSQLAGELSADPTLQIRTATTVRELWKQIELARPSVVLLDTQLVGDATPQLVAELTQKVKVATLLRTDGGGDLLLDSLNAGALAVLDKPASSTMLAQSVPSIIWNMRAAATANVGSEAKENVSSVQSNSATSMLAIGAGMGGLAALDGILCQLPSDAPGTIVIAPLPARLIALWAERLNRRCRVRVKLASDGHQITAGQVLVAPGDSHVLLRHSAQGFAVAVKNGPAVFHQKPSIEVLFNSVAEIAGGNAVGVLLSSAGVDGVAGLMNLKKSGGRTIAESPGSCVIADGPARAVKCGAAEAVVVANEIAAKMMEFAERTNLRAA